MTGSLRILLAIIVVGLMARLVYVLGYPQQPVAFDAQGYDSAAIAIVKTGHYPASNRPPLYPTFLAGVYWTIGHSHAAVRAVQAVLVSLIAVFAFLLGRSLFGHRQGVVAAAIVSFYPGFFAYAGLVLTETLFALLLAAFAWCFVQAWRYGGLRRAAVAGLVLGLATLCRGEIIGVAVPAAALLIWKHHLQGGLRDAVVLVAVTVLAVAPWGVRQYQTRHETLGLTNGVGATLWLSTYSGDWLEWYDREPLRSLVDCNCSAEELDRLLMREAVRNLVQSPGGYAWMSVKRVGRFWIGSHSNAVRGLEPSFQGAFASGEIAVLSVKALMLGLNLALFAAAAFGLYVWRESWHSWVPLVLIIGYVNLVHTFLFSTSRYQIPIIPMVAVLAACAAEGRAAGFWPRKVR